MTAMATDLLSAYIKYKTKRAEIKQRQRQELEHELEPLLKAVGKEILASQAEGKRIEDIEFEIGARNRTLIYDAKRLAKATELPAPIETAADDENVPVSPWKADYSERYNNWYVDVEGVNIAVLVYDEEGELVIPDEWAADPSPENQAMYKEIIRYIKTT